MARQTNPTHPTKIYISHALKERSKESLEDFLALRDMTDASTVVIELISNVWAHAYGKGFLDAQKEWVDIMTEQQEKIESWKRQLKK